MPNDKFIIKLQISLYPPGKEQCLIYNKERTVYDQLPIPKGLINMLQGRKKAYFWVTRSKNGTVTIVDGAPKQDW